MANFLEYITDLIDFFFNKTLQPAQLYVYYMVC